MSNLFKILFLSILLFCSNLFAQSVTITYNYDTIDRMTAVSYSTGETIDYTYDEAGNMTRVTHNGTTPGASMSLTPTSLSFANQAIGTESFAKSVTISNTGSVEITGLFISIQSSEYRQSTTCDTILAIGAECTVSVYFEPTYIGTKIATLRVDSSNTDMQTVSLSGTGISNDPTDTDGDGIPDSEDLDDDNDGMSDEFEIEHGLDPLDPDDVNEDSDGDGYTNLQEYQLGTDPTDRDDAPTNCGPQGNYVCDPHEGGTYPTDPFLESPTCIEGERVKQGTNQCILDGIKDSTPVYYPPTPVCYGGEILKQGVGCVPDESL